MKQHFNLHTVTLAICAVVVVFKQNEWAAAALAFSTFLFTVAQKFVPEKQDLTLQKIKELEKILVDQQTEISKLNILLGVGNVQKNRESVIRGLGVSGV